MSRFECVLGLLTNLECLYKYSNSGDTEFTTIS